MYKVSSDVLGWLEYKEGLVQVGENLYNGVELKLVELRTLQKSSPEKLSGTVHCFDGKTHMLLKQHSPDETRQMIKDQIRQARNYCSVGPGYRQNSFFETQEEVSFHKLPLGAQVLFTIKALEISNPEVFRSVWTYEL